MNMMGCDLSQAVTVTLVKVQYFYFNIKTFQHLLCTDQWYEQGDEPY